VRKDRQRFARLLTGRGTMADRAGRTLQAARLDRAYRRTRIGNGSHAADLRSFALTAREQDRIVRMKKRILAAARTSSDPAAQERARRLVDTVCRIAALLGRLSAPG